MERACVICGAPVTERKHRVVTCSRPCGYILRGQRRAAAFTKDRATGKLRGRYVDNRGYVRILVAPGQWRLEHRVVMEQMVGRPLERRDVVHHRNGQRWDNRPENLELWKRKEPNGVRASDYHCPGCRCFDRSSSSEEGRCPT